MDIYGLQQTESHPGPQEEHVVTEDHDADEESSTQDDCLKRVGVFCLHAKWSLENSGETVISCAITFLYRWGPQQLLSLITHSELVVHFVDVFVDSAVMQQAMEEVVPGVFDDSTAKALSQEVRPGRGERELFMSY